MTALMCSTFVIASREEDWIKCVPLQCKDATIDSCVLLPEQLKEFGKKWIFSRTSLFLHGIWGCGKTTFAFAVVRQLMRALKPGYYFWPVHTTGRELDRILLSATKKDGAEAHEIEKWSSVDLLLIDEIEKTPVSDRFKFQFFEILNNRYKNNLPTIIISNCEPKGLSEIFDGAILSRMSDSTKWKIICFPEDDLRKKIGAKNELM